MKEFLAQGLGRAPRGRYTGGMRFPALVLLFSAACAVLPEGSPTLVRAVDAPPASADSRPWYPSNRAPLAPSAFVKLPLGAIEPRGWLRRQLELQNSGFHGHLGEISSFLRKSGNAWLSPTGQGDHGWEEVPYWLKGFGDCAYLLGDREHIEEARVWIEAALASQRADGYFGPRGNGAQATVASTEGAWDLWPNMPMLDALRSWHEFSGDARVLPFMARYFRFELALPDADFVPPYWQHLRAYDNLWSVYWLFNRTDDAELRRDLLALAEKIERCAARWEVGVIDWHNVNVLQGFGGPTFFAMQSGVARHASAAERNYREFRAAYGQVPGGLFGSDEVARPGATDPRQAVETCGMVEFMFSCERLALATGDLTWVERCEEVALNQLPSALTADMRALRYLSAPNMATSDRTSHAPGLMNGGPMYCFDPHDHRCCQHNFGHGWPYLAQHLWTATADRGLCLMVPLESKVAALVGEHGARVEIECRGEYPLRPAVSLRLALDAPLRFPLYVRVPSWSDVTRVALNGERLGESSPAAGRALRIEREWRDGDTLEIDYLTDAAKPVVKRWPGNKDFASVEWGPLTYALEIASETRRSGGSDAWPAFEIVPSGPWNYALALEDPSIEVVARDADFSDFAWSPEQMPHELRMRARIAPGWTLDRHGLVAPLVQSPVRALEQSSEITLIPMGAARIRITAFPVAGAGVDVHDWPPAPVAPHPRWSVSASHTFVNDTADACFDGVEPESSADASLARHTFWPHTGGAEWIQYEFGAEIAVRGSEVYWFDDTGHGRCATPERWSLSYRDASGDWHALVDATYASPERDRWCAASFSAVRATALRLDVTLQPEHSAGVLEWRVDSDPR